MPSPPPEVLRRLAIEAMREAYEVAVSSQRLEWVSTRPEPKLGSEERVQRKMLFQLSSQLIENEIESLMDSAVSSWLEYRAATKEKKE